MRSVSLWKKSTSTWASGPGVYASNKSLSISFTIGTARARPSPQADLLKLWRKMTPAALFLRANPKMYSSTMARLRAPVVLLTKT
jgi:hypothetical protein